MAYTTIDDPSAYFQTKLYTGTGSSNAITGVGFQPDFCWIKNRGTATAARVFDSVRGATKVLYTSETDAEGTNAQSLKSFDSDGFTMGTHATLNASSNNIVSWNWKETATAGFDILTYEGTGSIQTEAHNLGVKPDMIIVKNIDSSDPPFNWRVYHSSLGAGVALKLNATDAVSDDPGYWGDTEPTSSVFSIKDSGETNNNNQTYIAYLFAGKQGYSKFGSYTATQNADGTFIYTGMKSAFIMVKNTAAAKNWYIFNNKTLGFNQRNDYLDANTTDVEESGNNEIDILSNGFKLRSGGTGTNKSGDKYIYMAFAENPFVTSTGVPATAR